MKTTKLEIEIEDNSTGATFKWNDGAPPIPWSTEWFIAELQDGSRVVLKALPKEFSYDFETLDETYYLKHKIKRWTQFHDSEFIEYSTSYFSKYNRVPIEEISKPIPGRICFPESYWCITPEREVLFFSKSHNAPQCNANKSIAERYCPKGCTVEKLPIVFLIHDCKDYVS